VSALQIVGEESSDNSLLAISKKFAELKITPVEDQQDKLEKTTVALSERCKDIQADLQKSYKSLRLQLIDLYKDKTKKIKVLVVNNDNDSERLDKIVSLLQNFCYYSTDKINYPSPRYAEKMVATEFAFFLSTHPSGIHELVKSLNTYHIPGLAIAYIERNGKTDEQAIRHGAQLQRAGFYVLYKIFTPIRLFTSIDKIFMKYYLAENR
jgi:hypothetical protein